MSKDYLSKAKMAEQLKRLEEHQTIHSDEVENKRLRIELAKVKQQLAIAVEQLKDTYVICFRNRDTLLHTPEHNIIGGIERDCAIALQQIKELEK